MPAWDTRKLALTILVTVLAVAAVLAMLVMLQRRVADEAFRTVSTEKYTDLCTIRNCLKHLGDEMGVYCALLADIAASAAPEHRAEAAKPLLERLPPESFFVYLDGEVVPPARRNLAVRVFDAVEKEKDLLFFPVSASNSFLVAVYKRAENIVVIGVDPITALKATHPELPLSPFSPLVVLDSNGGILVDLGKKSSKGFHFPSSEPAGDMSPFASARMGNETYYYSVVPLKLRDRTYRIFAALPQEDLFSAIGKQQQILLPPLALLIVVLVFALFLFFYTVRTKEELKLEKALRAETEKAREELEQTAGLLKNILISSSHFGIAALDENLRVLHLNPAAERMFGVNRAEALENDVIALHEKKGVPREKVLRHIERLESGEKVEFELHRETEDGGKLILLVTMMRMTDARGRKSGYLIVSRDVTREREAERRRDELERKFRETAKMQAVMRLAGGIAHDFNNILTGLTGYVELLKMRARDNASLLRIAEKVEKAAMKAVESTRKLVGLARTGKYRKTLVDVHRLIDDTLSKMKGESAADALLVAKDFKAGESVVAGDPEQLVLLFRNVLKNALEAMPAGGKLTVTTENAPSAEGGGQAIRITVKDTGEGIPPEIKERIFEPFFSTKANGRGLGLATVYGIVKNHGGSISISSEPGQGTTVEIVLPAERKMPLRGLSDEERKSGEPRGNEVLVVDDEEDIRNILSDVLENVGHKAFSASSGEKALEIFAARKDEIGLVLLDMVLPGMGGLECFRRMKSEKPDVKVILFSGYSADDEVRTALEEGAEGFFLKPFDMEKLLNEVEKALGR